MKRIFLVLVVMFFPGGGAMAGDYRFDASMLDGSAETDVALFNEGLQQPGLYYVTINVNGVAVDTSTVRFYLAQTMEGKKSLLPCLSVAQLRRFGIKTEEFSRLQQSDESGSCADLNAIPRLQTTFSFIAQSLSLLLPASDVQQEVKGIARETTWDDGLPALMLNYGANTRYSEYQQTSGRSRATQTDVQLLPGANLGAFRLRTSFSRQFDSGGPQQGWKNNYAYLTRGINALKSRLTLGDVVTPSDVFESTPVRGGMLESDENMVPYSQRSFSPVIRGSVSSQSELEIRQSGQVVFRTVVPPGPYSLPDYGATCSTGDLDVSVKESNGATHRFRVPCIAPPVALHQGYTRYQLSMGRFRNTGGQRGRPLVTQISAMHGLPLNTTLFGGIQLAPRYQAQTVGAGLTMGSAGGVSVDITQSQVKEVADTDRGRAVKLRYLWNSLSGLSVSLSKRWQGQGRFHTLNDAISLSEWSRDENSISQQDDIAVSWLTGGFGSLSLNATLKRYRADQGQDVTWGGGYSLLLPGHSQLNLTLSREMNRAGRQWTDSRASVSLNVPLDTFLKKSSVSWQMSQDTNSRAMQTILRGTTADNQLNWNLQQDTARRAGEKMNGAGLGGSYYGRYGNLYGNYYSNNVSRQLGTGLTGGVLLTGRGLTTGQYLGQTVALIDAPGVEGARIGFIPGEKTDARGYGIANGLAPYQVNTLSLDPLSFGSNAAIEQNTVNVVPTDGAVVSATYRTRTGHKALVTLTLPTGEYPPLGALVQIGEDKNNTAMVGDDGEVYLTGMPTNSTLNAHWGSGDSHSCTAHFILHDASSGHLLKEKLTCQ